MFVVFCSFKERGGGPQRVSDTRALLPIVGCLRQTSTIVTAEVHVELMLIHPFREGSGRLWRMLATLMALQAGLPILDFSDWDGETREPYFAAVRAGLDRDYIPMQKLFAGIIVTPSQAA
ncbi:Fic family protein [Geomonas ferrireducens]|uniref:Fic family protein n=1 Tax=Geomonas ferrireducens TaxID=2570227 RepID=UPI00319DFE61